MIRTTSMKSECKIEGCSQKVKTKGMCNKHYKRSWKGKDPSARTHYEATPKERLERRLSSPDPITGCIAWTGYRCKRGYGTIKIGHIVMGVHRLAYELANGPIPEGLHVLHRCDNPPCCNAEHLFAGTHQDNMADKTKKGRSTRFKGSQNGSSKLREEDIPKIRTLLDEGRSQASISKMFGVTQPSIHKVNVRKHWSHVD